MLNRIINDDMEYLKFLSAWIELLVLHSDALNDLTMCK